MTHIGQYLPVRSEEEAAALRHGTNYVEDQLPQSLKFAETQQLLAIVFQWRATNKYPLIEMHPGIGASSLVFASEVGGRILRLNLIENDPRLQGILENNIRHYGYSTNEVVSRNIHYDNYFSGVPANYVGGVGIFHPFIPFREPLQQEAQSSATALYSAQQSQQSSWLNKPIFIGPSPQKPLASILDILEKIRGSLQMGLFILPIGFPDTPEDPSLFKKWIPLSTFMILLILPQAGYSAAKLLPDLGNREATRDQAEKNILLLDRDILHALNESNRKRGFGELDISEFLSPKYVPIWIRAATSKDFDRDPLRNYERDEAYGDRVLKGAWATLMTEHHPNITPNELNLSGDLYMSKRKQPELARQLKLLDVALYIEGADLLKLREDLFESFVGALATVSNYVEGTGGGMVRAYQFLVYLFPTVPALTDLQPESTRVKEILEAMWFLWEIDPTSGPGRFILRMPRSMEDFLRREGRDVPPDRTLAVVTAPDWERAKQPLFAQALKTLATYRISKEQMSQWANKYRIDPTTLAGLVNVTSVQQKMQARHAVNLYWQVYPGPSGNVIGSLWEVIQEQRLDKRGRVKKAGQSSNFRFNVVTIPIKIDPITRRMETDQAGMVHSLIAAYLGPDVAAQPPVGRRG